MGKTMLNLLKTSAVAAVVAAAPFAASALTVIEDGGTYEVIPGETYLSTEVQGDGGAGSWMAKFFYPAPEPDSSLPAEARATIDAATLSAFSGLTISWLDADGMVGSVLSGPEAVVAFPGQTVLATVFEAPDFEQYLQIDWTGSTAGVDFDVVVEVAAVPVPAAGLMLLTALGGAAALRRRK
jgi:hypothetical protein